MSAFDFERGKGKLNSIMGKLLAVSALELSHAGRPTTTATQSIKVVQVSKGMRSFNIHLINRRLFYEGFVIPYHCFRLAMHENEGQRKIRGPSVVAWRFIIEALLRLQRCEGSQAFKKLQGRPGNEKDNHETSKEFPKFPEFLDRPEHFESIIGPSAKILRHP